MVGQEESTVARRAAPEDRRKIQRIAPTGIVSRITSQHRIPSGIGRRRKERPRQKKLRSLRIKTDTCVRNASTGQGEPEWDAVTISQLQDTAEAVSRKNAQYL